MGSCCGPGRYEGVFSEKYARDNARSYRKKGLDRDARRIVDFVRDRLKPGYTLLEVGGGVGAIQLELLKDGASRATNVEISSGYESAAEELLRERGLADRVDRRVGDFAELAPDCPAADLVVMHRVVCCYPDAERLVGAAAARSRHYLVMTFPVDRWWTRAALTVANAFQALRRDEFRGFVHPLNTVLGAARRQGLRLATRRTGFIWQFVALERGA